MTQDSDLTFMTDSTLGFDFHDDSRLGFDFHDRLMTRIRLSWLTHDSDVSFVTRPRPSWFQDSDLTFVTCDSDATFVTWDSNATRFGICLHDSRLKLNLRDSNQEVFGQEYKSDDGYVQELPNAHTMCVSLISVSVIMMDDVHDGVAFNQPKPGLKLPGGYWSSTGVINSPQLNQSERLDTNRRKHERVC